MYIAEALDEGSMTALIMRDLSAAFGVIDHPILLKRLVFSFDIKENNFTWIKSTPLTELSVFLWQIKHYQMYVFILMEHRDQF